MRITKRQLKRIIREEYSKLNRKGLIETSYYNQEMEKHYGDDALAQRFEDRSKKEDETLYTNISDQESASLDALEACVVDCVSAGCAEEDVMDTVEATLKDFGGAQGYER